MIFVCTLLAGNFVYILRSQESFSLSLLQADLRPQRRNDVRWRYGSVGKHAIIGTELYIRRRRQETHGSRREIHVKLPVHGADLGRHSQISHNRDYLHIFM